jgi:hypothetical protein
MHIWKEFRFYKCEDSSVDQELKKRFQLFGSCGFCRRFDIMVGSGTGKSSNDSEMDSDSPKIVLDSCHHENILGVYASPYSVNKNIGSCPSKDQFICQKRYARIGNHSN